MADCNKLFKYKLFQLHKSKSISAFTFSIAIWSIHNSLSSQLYPLPGLYGSIFGGIAGSFGTRAANSKLLSDIRCQWIAHIVLVCWYISTNAWVRLIILVHFYDNWLFFGTFFWCGRNVGNCTLYVWNKCMCNEYRVSTKNICKLYSAHSKDCMILFSGGCQSSWYYDDECTQMKPLMAIETSLCFSKSSIWLSSWELLP